MLQQSYKKYETVPYGITLVLLLALAGMCVTAAQVALIVYSGDILCLNEGCEIVESLTRVPPVIFNLAGFGYFALLFFFFLKGRNGATFWLNVGRLLALAGMAAEGVLVAFQHYIAEVFCSYCLIILATICLINLFVGLRQLFNGLVLFGAVVIAFSALQFRPASQAEPANIENGTYARLEKEGGGEVFLFFSETCPHCEDVIAALREDLTCSVNFNPIDEVSGVEVDGAHITGAYNPDVNKTFLKTLGIREIPVLMFQGAQGLQVLKGKSAINNYLEENCYAQDSPDVLGEEGGYSTGQSGVSSMNQIPASPYIFQEAEADESCEVDVDCEPSSAESGQL